MIHELAVDELESHLVKLGTEYDKVLFDTSAVNLPVDSNNFAAFVLGVNSIDEFVEEHVRNVVSFSDLMVAMLENFRQVTSIDDVVDELGKFIHNLESKRNYLVIRSEDHQPCYDDPKLGRATYGRIIGEYINAVKLVERYLHLRRTSFADDPLSVTIFEVLSSLNKRFRFDEKTKTAERHNAFRGLSISQSNPYTDQRLVSVALAGALRGESVAVITQDSDYLHLANSFYQFLSSKDLYVPERLVERARRSNLAMFNNGFLRWHTMQEPSSRSYDFSTLGMDEAGRAIKNRLHKLLIYL